MARSLRMLSVRARETIRICYICFKWANRRLNEYSRVMYMYMCIESVSIVCERLIRYTFFPLVFPFSFRYVLLCCVLFGKRNKNAVKSMCHRPIIVSNGIHFCEREVFNLLLLICSLPHGIDVRCARRLRLFRRKI